MTDTSNYGALSEGLRFYVAAMRRFIARTLREQHGDSDAWFNEQVMPKLPKPMRNSIQQRWAAQQRQRASNGGDGPELLLDPVHFRYVINAHWDNTYEAIFGERVALHWIGEIAYWRNVWAHVADKAEAEADRILDTCARVVERFDPEATQQIERIRAGLTAAPATDSEAAIDQPPPDDDATDDGPGEAQNEETASDVRVDLRELGFTGTMRTPIDLRELGLAGTREPEPPQNETLRELVREYWQYQQMPYLGEAGLVNEEAATRIWAETIPSLTLDLVREAIVNERGWSVDYQTDPPTYAFFIESGINVMIQIEFPKWALEDGV